MAQERGLRPKGTRVAADALPQRFRRPVERVSLLRPVRDTASFPGNGLDGAFPGTLAFCYGNRLESLFGRALRVDRGT